MTPTANNDSASKTEEFAREQMQYFEREIRELETQLAHLKIDKYQFLMQQKFSRQDAPVDGQLQ